MESWRKERDTLVSALEVQLKKLITSNAEKDQQIKILQFSNTSQTPEVSQVSVTDLTICTNSLKHLGAGLFCLLVCLFFDKSVIQQECVKLIKSES